MMDIEGKVFLWVMGALAGLLLCVAVHAFSG